MGVVRGVCCGCTAAALVPLAVFAVAFFDKPKVHVPVPVNIGEAGAFEAGSAPSRSLGSKAVYDRVAAAYDPVSRWTSLTLDARWRKALVNDCLGLEAGDKVLDLASGTGEVGLMAFERLQKLGGGEVTAIDASEKMLCHAVSKAGKKKLGDQFRVSRGDAQDLSTVEALTSDCSLEPPKPMAESSVDKVAMAFGIRDVADRAAALRQMRRVVSKRPNSRVCILEYSLPTGDSLVSRVARRVIAHAVPIVARIATMSAGDEAYAHLEDSILGFPQPQEFAAAMAREGLPVRSITSFAFGSVHLYSAAPPTP